MSYPNNRNFFDMFNHDTFKLALATLNITRAEFNSMTKQELMFYANIGYKENLAKYFTK
jgi:hypothetical protein